MNEPSAAAVAYGLYRTSTDLPNPDQPPRHVAFVDFGSSALQVAIAAFHKGKVKVSCYQNCIIHLEYVHLYLFLQMLATAFDPSLGGRAIDVIMAQHFAQGFNKPGYDVTKNKRSWIRLLAEVTRVNYSFQAANTLKYVFFYRLTNLNVKCQPILQVCRLISSV